MISNVVANIPDYCIPATLPTTGGSPLVGVFAALVLAAGIGLLLAARRKPFGIGLVIVALGAAGLVAPSGSADAQTPPACPPGYIVSPDWGNTTAGTTTTTMAPGSTTTAPGSTTTVPGSTTTVPGSTTTAPLPVPDLTPVIDVQPEPLFNKATTSQVVEVKNIGDAATDGSLITVRVTKDIRWTLGAWNGSLASLGGYPLDNTEWTFDNTNANFYILTTTTVIPAGDSLWFGFAGTWDAGATQGTATFSVNIQSLSGGEVNISNNSAADAVNYFMNDPDARPDLTPVIDVQPEPLFNGAPTSQVVRVRNVGDAPTTGLITVRVIKDIGWVLGGWDEDLESLGGYALDNFAWNFSNTDSAYILTTNAVIPAGDSLWFGFPGTWNAAGTGIVYFNALIQNGSGGEVNFSNNFATDAVDYVAN